MCHLSPFFFSLFRFLALFPTPSFDIDNSLAVIPSSHSRTPDFAFFPFSQLFIEPFPRERETSFLFFSKLHLLDSQRPKTYPLCNIPTHDFENPVPHFIVSLTLLSPIRNALPGQTPCSLSFSSTIL